MKKAKFEMESNRRANKLFYRWYLDNIGEHDAWGPMHSGCYNSQCWRDRSWKRYRKTQYK